MADDPRQVVRLYARLYGIYSSYANATIIRWEEGQEYNSYVQQLSSELNDNLSMYEIDKHHFNDKSKFYPATPFRACIEGLLAYLRTKVDPEAVSRIGYTTDNTPSE